MAMNFVIARQDPCTYCLDIYKSCCEFYKNTEMFKVDNIAEPCDRYKNWIKKP